MKKSVFIKVFMGQCLVIGALTAFILIFSYSAVRSFYLYSLARDLESLAKSLRYEIVDFLDSGENEALNTYIKTLGEEIETRITVIDREGTVLADSEENPENMENHRARPEIFKAYSGEVGQSLRFSRTLQTKMLYIGIPLYRGGGVAEVLRVSLYLRDIRSLILALRNRVVPVVLAALVLSLLIAYLSSRTISNPIRELVEASKRIAGGDFSTKVRFRKKNEFYDLANNFNLMTDRIGELFNGITQKKSDLDDILRTMSEGLISVDGDDRIHLANESLSAISGVNDCVGKHYWEVIRDPNIMDMIKISRAEGRNVLGEIELKSGIYLCSINFQKDRRDLVITLHDISETKKLAAMKKDLIANASHELRTPLTSIIGYIDTLEDHMDEKGKDFLTVVKKNTDRLSSIVSDLMLLSELETLDLQLGKEEVDIVSVLQDAMKLFDRKIKDKGLEIQWEVGNDLPRINAEPFRLEQMFTNIIDNAVKYTDTGSITISVDQLPPNSLKVSIKDTGIGMAAEHIPRIFERFYVADKARTRKLGGTGLGLAIVKHITKLHGGEVGVKSTPGKGSVFTVVLPIS